MTIHYSLRFSVRCDHGFYASGRAEDLIIVPTAECQDLLRRHRLMLKTGATGSAVAIDEQHDFGPPGAPDIRPVVPVPDDTVFRFAVRLRDARFFTITDLDQQALKPGRAFVFSSTGVAAQNVGGKNIVQVHTGPLPAPVTVLPKRFTLSADPALEPMRIEVRDHAGRSLIDRVLPPRGGPPSAGDEPITAFIDGTGLSDGLYSVRFLDKNGTVVSTTEAFISRDGRERGIVAFVEVNYQAAVMNLDPRPVFTIGLPVRAVRWIYDITVRPVSDPALAATAIDARRLALAGGPVPFTRDPDPIPPPPAPPPARLTFTSNASIPLREAPHTDIQLVQNAPAGTPPPADPDVIVPNLPNPRPGRLELAAGQLQSRIHLTVN